MVATLILSALLTAQAAAVLPDTDQVFTRTEVAFEDLSNGRTDQAVVMLEAQLLEKPADPATLINLGTAYARQGKLDRAAGAFRAAINSETPYQVELADGSWVDSRRAARQALQGLERSFPLAALSE